MLQKKLIDINRVGYFERDRKSSLVSFFGLAESSILYMRCWSVLAHADI